MVGRCHVCERPRELIADDDWRVVLRNGLIVPSCQSCWQLWPDPFKHFPPGRFGQPEGSHDLVELLSEVA